MNKSELIASIAHSAQISKIAAERGLNEVLSTLSAAIKDGKRVILLGFGSFTVVERGPRNGRNPKTGEMVPIPSRRVIKFRPGKELSEKIL